MKIRVECYSGYKVNEHRVKFWINDSALRRIPSKISGVELTPCTFVRMEMTAKRDRLIQTARIRHSASIFFVCSVPLRVSIVSAL
jgi:hypothetical protein